MELTTTPWSHGPNGEQNNNAHDKRTDENPLRNDNNANK